MPRLILVALAIASLHTVPIANAAAGERYSYTYEYVGAYQYRWWVHPVTGVIYWQVWNAYSYRWSFCERPW